MSKQRYIETCNWVPGYADAKLVEQAKSEGIRASQIAKAIRESDALINRTLKSCSLVFVRRAPK